MNALNELESQLQDAAYRILVSRWDRLRSRKLVIFRLLRIRMLLKRIRIIQGK